MRKILSSVLGLLSLALLLAPHAAAAQTCGDNAARGFLAGNLMDSMLNPPKGEDAEFYTTTGGVPNIMFVIDTSGSMERLPPNGPAFLGGLNPTMPAGHLLTDPTVAAQQTSTYNDHTRVVGCGLDPIFTSTSNVGNNAMLQVIMDRRFYSPCGLSASDATKLPTDPSSIGDLYRGHVGLVTGGLDYAHESSVCPDYTPSDPLATGADGYDPDFYSTNTTATTVSGKPAFFGRDLVFHDAINDGDLYATNALKFGHNFGNGWKTDTASPAKIGNAVATIDTFCNSIDTAGTWMQGTQKVTDICNTCLKQAGWFYDGIILQHDQEHITNKQYPSIWYTGNYLNFFPPKMVIARKIVKDVIAVQSKVRMGLGHFGSNGVAIDQGFNPTCDHPDSNFDSNRTTYVNSVNGLSFGGGTPLSMALLDVGRYYHSPGLSWFGMSSGPSSSSNSNQYAICYSCQTSSVILLTDGSPSDGDGTTSSPALPAGTVTTAQVTGGTYAGNTGTGIRGLGTSMCPNCGSFSGASDYENNAPRVAWYLHNMDLRDNTEGTRDCAKNGGKQVLNTYTVGFATAQLPDANTILTNTAAAGGGLFISADNAQVLKSGIASIIEYINNRDTSFSVATVSTLQTTAGRTVIVPRFEPAKNAHFKGHLLRFDLYSEFVNTCTEKTDGSGAGDFDCDGHCSSVFLQDKDGSYVVEDGAGSFVKTDGSVSCSTAPLCNVTSPPGGKTCSSVTGADAVPWWDAGSLMAGSPAASPTSQKWKARRVFTAVDSNGDGKIDISDTVMQLDPTNDTTVDALVPYLGLGSESVCNGLASLYKNAGNDPRALVVAPATTTATSLRECARSLIRYVLGADVFNEVGKDKATYVATAEDSLWDRFWALGDIFHSSPVVVDPPLPRTGVLCKNGLSNQCLESLWATPTDSGQDAYDAFASDPAYVNRQKITLVGANDGLLHAFDVGSWHGNPTPGVHYDGADDPTTTNLDESLPPFNGYYDKGTGAEVWAFLPPDMLSKIPLYATSSLHQFFVDGNPWVRDVWVDGSSNGLTAATAKNDVKDKQEFHTIAVVGERRGGTHFFALDVTNATSSSGTPMFLWVYPQPNSKETLEFGETYNDTLPRPPPIGPVRFQVDATDPVVTGHTKTMAVGASTISYHERWVTFLNGGFDPQYLRGRGVHMVDVWTGEELFDFSYSTTTTDVRNSLRFPVPAAVGMVGWGANAKRDPLETNDYFFDTATFGDAGGQLWALRFHLPGTRGSGTDTRVTNWSGGRVFQMGVSSQACRLCAGQPFFYMTANVPVSNGNYRVLAGTGDRFNLLDTNGGTCGPDNIRACILRGCTVTLDKASNLLEANGLASEQRGLSQTACANLTSTATDGTVATCAVNGKAKVVISACPSPVPNNGPTGVTKDMQVSCGIDAMSRYSCSQTTSVPGTTLVLSDTSNNITLGNWFYSLLVFEQSSSTRPIFDDQTTANTYDANRLYLNQTGLSTTSTPYTLLGTSTYTSGLVPIAAMDPNPSSLANADSKGWAMYYDRSAQITADTHTYNVNWNDERTSSGSAVLSSDIFWNTNLTAAEVTGTTTGCDVRKCASIQAKRISTKYGADIETGGLPLRLYDPITNAATRYLASALLVPTQADQPTVFVNQKGQIAVGLTAVNPERGATNVGQTDPSDPAQDFGFLEIDRKTHDCRHEQNCQ